MAAVAPLDYETRTAFSLQIQAQDDGDGALTGSSTITVNLRDVNEAPFMSRSASREVNENVAGGTVLGGGAVTGTDVDADQTLSYTIES